MKNNCIIVVIRYFSGKGRESVEVAKRFAVVVGPKPMSARWGCSARFAPIYRSGHPKGGRSIAKEPSENAGELRRGKVENECGDEIICK